MCQKEHEVCEYLLQLFCQTVGPLGSGSAHRKLLALTSLPEHFLASEQEILSVVDILLVSC